MLNKSGLHLNEHGTTQLVNKVKKVKIISLNSSVANTGRPIISRTNFLEENFSDSK